MTSTEALQSAIDNTVISAFNNGTNKITLQETYPSFDSELDTSLLVDLLILPQIELPSNTTIEVQQDGVSQGNFILSSSTKAMWLSELMGVARETLSTQISKNYLFTFTSTQLLKFQLITALSADFISANTVLTNGLSSNMFLLHGTEISPADDNSISAIRDAIDNSKTIVSKNGTNSILITNSYPTFGSALSQTFVADSLIIFKNQLPMGTDIDIKHNGVHVKTMQTESNFTSVWLSDLLKVNRDLLYTKTNETYELTFVYDQNINVQIFFGELAAFTYANVVARRIAQGLFELTNSKSLDVIPIETNDCNYTVNYDDYDKAIKSAKLNINESQYQNLDFIIDSTSGTTVYLLRESNYDTQYNLGIDLIMSQESIENRIALLRDCGRKLYELNLIASQSASSTSSTLNS